MLDSVSALQEFQVDGQPATILGQDVLVEEQVGTRQLILRGNAQVLDRAVSEKLGIRVPTVPNTVQLRYGGVACLWQRPDQWLLVAAAQRVRDLRQVQVLKLNGAWVLDAGSRFLSLRIAGALAADLMAEGCSVDLRPDRFAHGDCAATLFDRLPVQIYRPSADPEYMVMVERPLAWHLWQSLQGAVQRGL